MTSKNINIYSVILATLLITAVFPAQSQTGSEGHNESVTIVSSFDPSINQAYKLNTSPEELTFDMEKPEFSFQSLDIDQPTEITLNPIKPVVINADKRTSITKNSIIAGLGSLFSPYLDFSHSSGQKNNYGFNAHIYHLSSFKNIADYSPSPQTESYVDLNFKKYFKYHIFNAGVLYSISTNRYYGFKPDDFPTITIPDNKLKQSFNLAKARFGISSNYKNNKKLFHKVEISSYYYFDKHNTSETNADVSFDLYKSFNVSDLLDYQKLGMLGQVSYFRNIDSINSTNDIFVSATPYFKGKYGVFNFNLGLNFNVLNTDKTNFYFYPILDLSVNLIPDYVTLYAGLDGNVQKHSFLKVSELNPWVSSTVPTEWGRTFKAFGGIKGNVGQKVNFNAQVAWEKFNNMYFFVNVTDDTIINPLLPLNKFSVLYDDGSVFILSGEITYEASELVNISAGAKYNMYTLDTLAAPYHKPTSEVKLGISFLITKQLKIWTEGYYYGKRTALNLSSIPANQVDLDAFIDVNLGANYQLTDNFSAFLSLTNILNKKYQRYYQYPVHGIQIMGGIMYKF